MRRSTRPVRVLAVDPAPRGFGFVILEGPRAVIDWGVRSGRAASIEREQQLLLRFSDLVGRYRPTMVVFENMSAPESRRQGRARLLVATMTNFATWQKIAVREISQSQVKQVFKTFGARSKYEVACAISRQVPEIASWLPKKRKPWNAEDYRMAAFNAAALALTYFYGRSR